MDDEVADGTPSFGFCSAKSGKSGCVGERKVRRYKGFEFCDRCWIHRARLAKMLGRR